MGKKFELYRLMSLGGSQAILLIAPPLPAPPFPRYALASHFFWGLWSILQASMSTIEFGYLVSSLSGGHVGWGLRRALVMSSSKSRQSPVAVGRTQQLLAPASKPSRCSALPFPSLGICPVSLPVLLPAEGAADQFPPIILTTQPHL